MTQGYPLDMVAYGIIILPLTKVLKSTYPDVTQTCYVDDAREMGTFDHLENYFKSLKHNGPARGYFPDPTKIILVVHPQNLETDRNFVNVTSLRCVWAHVI